MSNPAIVLMTDPSRCNLGDVHHLVQALLEIQQMGQHALPQAFCDHPAAAEGFIDAYVQAYPQLVVEDGEIPTPEHLHSLITTGQVGALTQLPELAPVGEVQRPAELNGVPIVLLTLGSSQALIEALQQSPMMRESIRLIDVAPDRADPLSISIADAVAIRGPDGQSWEHERSGMERPELDEVAVATKADATSLALHDDPMSLDVLEPVDILRSERPAYEQGEHRPAPVSPVLAVPQPVPVNIAEPAMPLPPLESPAITTIAEPAPATTAQVATAQPIDAEPVGPSAQSLEPEGQSLEPEGQGASDGADLGEGQDGKPSKGQAAAGKDGAGKNDVGKDGDLDKDGDAPAKGGKAAPDEDDDVVYPAVASLSAGSDVVYPVHDRGGAHGILRELASVILDDDTVDPDLAAAFSAAGHDEGLPVTARHGAIVAVRSSDKVDTIEDFHGAGGQPGEDELADASAARALHDSDL